MKTGTVLQTKANDATGKITDVLHMTKQGEYRYTIREKQN